MKSYICRCKAINAYFRRPSRRFVDNHAALMYNNEEETAL
jgi:hypothetical protein